MMTFVIRNGLRALALGLGTYLGYVDSLARSWGLSAAQAQEVRHAGWGKPRRALSPRDP
jgi:hypothetical protein